MKYLSKVATTALESYQTCTADLDDRYEAISTIIDSLSQQYELLASEHKLHLMPEVLSASPISKRPTDDELRDLYKLKFSPVRSLGRDIYDRIKLLSIKCPLCSIGRVRELDHYLPKKNFPALSINPSNLVPVCKDCNYDKRAQRPTKEEENWPHPYFDNIQDARWLTCRLVRSLKPEILFTPLKPDDWPTEKFIRVQNYFDDLELGLKYSIEAGVRLVEIAGMLTEVHEELGLQGVIKHLSKSSSSIARSNINHWEAILYAGLSTDNWYCDGGFKAFQ